ncbi:helix-turn-helix domain-containing protein [Streptomyces sp. GMY02]|uniref:helix-turn-helix domain-containing protein n=1 Tax=Streptomyces sp. GMY02 TaxID=1333528 RepID=UPI001C2B98D8|nr:helix-turn-helix transcriptional regulator [Streptomyces sp. GMY02]QXE33996.1 helix-turn-helix domain-containing protein [Streptomyces sp. GMY02]
MAGDGEFGKTVRAALRSQKLSVRAAARATNYDHAFLSRVLSGRQRPSGNLAKSLDKLLGMEGLLMELFDAISDEDHERLAAVSAQEVRLDARAVQAFGAVLTAQRRLDDVTGPGPMVHPARAQSETVRRILRDASGKHRDDLAMVFAEHVQFDGWLAASTRNDADAVKLLSEAAKLAEIVESGPLIAQARNFRGYVARQQGRPHEMTRWFLAAYETPGAHPAQRMGDASQAAHGYAQLGQRDTARRLLDDALGLSDAATDAPPDTAYWLTPMFQRLNIGLACLGLGQPGEAAEHIRAGLRGLPLDQQGAEWTREYRRALQLALASV